MTIHSVTRLTIGVLALGVLSSLLANLNGFAQEQTYKRVYDAHLQRYTYVPNRTVGERLRGDVHTGWRNPLIRDTAIGVGAGAATSAITGRSSLLKGAGVGAATGAATGLIDNSRYLEQHHLLKSTLKGTAIGTGAGVVTEGSVGKSAAIGAGAGAASHWVRQWWDNR